MPGNGAENVSAGAMVRPLTIVVPVLNEAPDIETSLRALAPLRAEGHEVVVVDGGSDDGTLAALAGLAALVDQTITAPRGRALQMNAGALAARGEALLFLHADTALPPGAASHVLAALQGGSCWGRFDLRIDGRSPLFPVIAALMNLRSRWTGIATGDQAIFVRRDAFLQVGGFSDQPLMEDIELSRRLRAIARPCCLRARVVTSGRRWERHGVLRTIGLMWLLRLRYWLGVPAAELARSYR